MGKLFGIGVLAGIWVLGACGSHKSSDELAALEAKQREHAQRLAQLQQQIADAERAAEAAKRRAALEQCHADAASIDAAAMMRSAECMREVANASKCAAEAAKEKGDSTLFGCVLGMAATYVSGGALGELAVAGCIGGRVHGELSAPECPRPACVDQAGSWLVEAAKARGHTGLPICELGMELVEISRTSPGLLLGGTFQGAVRAGLRRGDVLVRVNGQPVATRDQLAQSLGSVSAGTAVPVEYVRNGTAGRTTVKTTDRDNTGEAAGRTLLGISANEDASLPAVDHVAVAIAAVTPGSAAAGSGLQPGELIQGVGDGTPLRASALADVLRRHPDAPIRLLVTNRGKARVLTVRPAALLSEQHSSSAGSAESAGSAKSTGRAKSTGGTGR